MTLILAACTSTSDDGAVNITSGTVTAASVSRPSSTLAAVTGAPELAVDRGVDVEAGVITLGLIGSPSDEFRAGYAAYWEAQNVGGGVGAFSMEVVEFSSVDEAENADVVMVSMVGSQPDDENDLVLVEDLIAPPNGDVVAVASTFPTLLDGADIVGYDIVVDSQSPTSCTESAPGRTVIDADQAAIGDGSIVVLCTDPQTSTELIEVGGDWTSVAVVAWSWDPGAASLVGDRPFVVVGSTPGPGVDEAPAGEILALALGEGPWTFDMVAGYTTARSLHAVLDSAMRSGDVRRAAILEALDKAGGLDFGFGPSGVTVGPADADSPTGVLVVEWRSPG